VKYYVMYVKSRTRLWLEPRPFDFEHHGLRATTPSCVVLHWEISHFESRV